MVLAPGEAEEEVVSTDGGYVEGDDFLVSMLGCEGYVGLLLYGVELVTSDRL